MELVEKIKSEAAKKNLNLKQLALKAGMGENTIYKWNKQSPSAQSLQKVADVLGVTTDYLLGRPVSEKKTNTQPAGHQPKKYQDLDDKNTVMLYGGQALTDDELAVIKSVLTAYRNEKRGE